MKARDMNDANRHGINLQAEFYLNHSGVTVAVALERTGLEANRPWNRPRTDGKGGTGWCLAIIAFTLWSPISAQHNDVALPKAA